METHLKRLASQRQSDYMSKNLKRIMQNTNASLLCRDTIVLAPCSLLGCVNAPHMYSQDSFSSPQNLHIVTAFYVLKTLKI